ncbi:UNVERIFIED_CONTAM: General transcription and DNA repair factor IIH subunit TFB4 [Sesamum calycinum]|uniref:General transcription and DNA repair factor IIH subunit TFB4 n=1 Tax=Sesamum calycinum TaxID=2727403 RepID=A0AAW2PRP7_9LAMI
MFLDHLNFPDDVSLLMVLAFLNAIVLLNQLNQVVVIATGYNSCDYIFDSSTSEGQTQRAEYLLQKLEEFVNKDESLCREDSVDGPGFSLLSGSLSMALCLNVCFSIGKDLFPVTLHNSFRHSEGVPVRSSSSILGISVLKVITFISVEISEWYVAIMNSIFSAQRSMVNTGLKNLLLCVKFAASLFMSLLVGHVKPFDLNSYGLVMFIEQAKMIFKYGFQSVSPLIFLDIGNGSYRFMCNRGSALCFPAAGFLYNWCVYLKPQLLDGLFQYLSTVFATDLHSRGFLQLPKPAGVDFRASCFCHKNTIDMGYICSVCLSIFCKHQKKCSTCGSVFGQAPVHDSSTPDRKRKTPMDA